MIEIELKFKIEENQINSILENLQRIGFSFGHSRFYEKTVMFDNKDKIMQKTDGRIRLRSSGDLIELGYKKPLTREGIKKEIEYEVSVSDFELTEKILKEMGFYPTTSYERYRTLLIDNNKTKVTIDEYPFAVFIEIEGEENKIIEIASKLDLNLKKNLTDACDTLFQQWRKERGLPFKPHMRFEDYDK